MSWKGDTHVDKKIIMRLCKRVAELASMQVLTTIPFSVYKYIPLKHLCVPNMQLLNRLIYALSYKIKPTTSPEIVEGKKSPVYIPNAQLIELLVTPPE